MENQVLATAGSLIDLCSHVDTVVLEIEKRHSDKLYRGDAIHGNLAIPGHLSH